MISVFLHRHQNPKWWAAARHSSAEGVLLYWLLIVGISFPLDLNLWNAKEAIKAICSHAVSLMISQLPWLKSAWSMRAELGFLFHRDKGCRSGGKHHTHSSTSCSLNNIHFLCVDYVIITVLIWLKSIHRTKTVNVFSLFSMHWNQCISQCSLYTHWYQTSLLILMGHRL